MMMKKVRGEKVKRTKVIDGIVLEQMPCSDDEEEKKDEDLDYIINFTHPLFSKGYLPQIDDEPIIEQYMARYTPKLILDKIKQTN